MYADTPELKAAEVLPVIDHLAYLFAERHLPPEESAPLADAVRVGCPGEERAFARLEAALRTALAPAGLCLRLRGDRPDDRTIATWSARLPLSDAAARTWTLTDTPDGVGAAREAGGLPLGLLPPDAPDGAAEALLRAGAARVLDDPDDLTELLR